MARLSYQSIQQAAKLVIQIGSFKMSSRVIKSPLDVCCPGGVAADDKTSPLISAADPLHDRPVGKEITGGVLKNGDRLCSRSEQAYLGSPQTLV